MESRRDFLTDAVLSVALAAFMLPAALLSPGTVRPLGYALLLAGALSLAARRMAPRTVLAVTTLCVLCYQFGAGVGIVTTFPLAAVGAFPALIAVYTAASTGHRASAVAAAAAIIFGVFGISALVNPGTPARQILQSRLSIGGWLVAAGVLGEVARQHAAYVRQVEQRAAEAERTREEAALRRADEERLRIARELHDSLTHTISVIKVHAGVAVHLARKRGEDVPDALLAIQDASREAIRELRATLEVLRQGGGPAGADGLDRLPDLLDMVSSTGLKATLTVSGRRRPLRPEVSRAAYRIIQEALTNVSRHAGDATATVHLTYQSRALTVQVDDDGQAVPWQPVVPGTGLTGMRERVSALGGELSAGPRPEGGFTVLATLPAEPAVAAGEQERS